MCKNDLSSMNVLLESAHLPVSWWTKMSILGLFRAINVIYGKSAMDLTGILIGPIVWCARGDTKKTKIAYKKKYEWAQKNPNTPVTSAHGGYVITPASDEANTTYTSHDGRTLITGVEVTPQQLDSNPYVYVPPPPRNMLL
jgi:hypothetical protein